MRSWYLVMRKGNYYSYKCARSFGLGLSGWIFDIRIYHDSGWVDQSSDSNSTQLLQMEVMEI